jgi:hypothetical protein
LCSYSKYSDKSHIYSTSTSSLLGTCGVWTAWNWDWQGRDRLPSEVREISDHMSDLTAVETLSVTLRKWEACYKSRVFVSAHDEFGRRSGGVIWLAKATKNNCLVRNCSSFCRRAYSYKSAP